MSARGAVVAARVRVRRRGGSSDRDDGERPGRKHRGLASISHPFSFRSRFRLPVSSRRARCVDDGEVALDLPDQRLDVDGLVHARHCGRRRPCGSHPALIPPLFGGRARCYKRSGGDSAARPSPARPGGFIVPLPRRQQRALLAVLALHADEVVSTDRLIEDLWGCRRAALRARLAPERRLLVAQGRRAGRAPDGAARVPARARARRRRRACASSGSSRRRAPLRPARAARCSPTRSRSGAGPRSTTSPSSRSPASRSPGSRGCGSTRKRSGSPASSASAGTTGSCPSSSRWSPRTRSESGCAAS